MPKRTVAIVLAGLAGCGAPQPWDGRVSRWGTIREVLRDGATEARVGVLEATAPHTIGIGAIESLDGEIAILDGRAWVCRADGVAGPASADDRATFLATSRVERWRGVGFDGDAADLERVLEGELAGAEAFPFVVEGRFESIDSHVLNGRCPFNPEDTRGEDPVRAHREAIEGTLVGFFSRQPPGTLAHHGSKLHVHVLFEGAAPYAGHVDRFRLSRGGRLMLPKQ